LTDTLPRIAAEPAEARLLLVRFRSVLVAAGLAALIAGIAAGFIAAKDAASLAEMLLDTPDGYVAQSEVTMSADEAARLGSDPAREAAALSKAGFRGGELHRSGSASGNDQLAVLGYEFRDGHAATNYLEHAVADFKRHVLGATSFDTGLDHGAGFISRRSGSNFVFVYLAQGRFVFAITSGGRSPSHDAREGRELARAQHDRV
jgi:hypothetical protein